METPRFHPGSSAAETEAASASLLLFPPRRREGGSTPLTAGSLAAPGDPGVFRVARRAL